MERSIVATHATAWGLWLSGGWWVCSMGNGPWTASESQARKAADHWNEQERAKPCAHVAVGRCYKCVPAADQYVARSFVLFPEIKEGR